MSIETSIEWADSTLNLQMGCDGCELWNEKTGVRKRYAGAITERYGGKPGWPDSFTQPKLFLERLTQLLKWPDLTGKTREDKPWLNGYPRMIFLDDMGDTFTESLPLDWLARPWTFCPKGHSSPIVQHLLEEKLCICMKCAVTWRAESPLDLMGRTPHIYMLLTKRPNRMRQFSERHPFPENFWLFTSVTDRSTVGRLADLSRVQGGSILGVSYAPALGPVDFNNVRVQLAGESFMTLSALHATDALNKGTARPRLDLVIVGGESGPGARPFDIQWARDTVRQCKSANVACFVKQLGSVPIVSACRQHHFDFGEEIGRKARFSQFGHDTWRVHLKSRKGADMSEWPEDLRVRELPEAQ